MNINTVKVKEWIIAQSPDIQDIDADENLMEYGCLDSIQFLELINLIEDLSGKIVDTSTINIADFLTLNAIENKFFN